MVRSSSPDALALPCGESLTRSHRLEMRHAGAGGVLALNTCAQQPIDTQVPETPNLGTYLRPLRQRAWLIALVAIVVAAATYLYYESRPKDYVATTTLLAQMSPL